jgi:acetolactate synthase regulatory subunit
MHESTKRDIVGKAMTQGSAYIERLWDCICDENEENKAEQRILSTHVEFLNHPERYPPDLCEQARQQFPKAKLPEWRWEMPAGFQTVGWFKGWFFRLVFRRLLMLEVPGHPERGISVFYVGQTDMLFPWQLAIELNLYLKSKNQRRLLSRYVTVLNSTGYEVCYHAPFIKVGLQRAHVALVVEPERQLHIALETTSLEQDKPAFDKFLASFR